MEGLSSLYVKGENVVMTDLSKYKARMYVLSVIHWGHSIWPIATSSCHHLLLFCFVLDLLLECYSAKSACHLISCSTSESLMSPVKQAPRKSPSDTEVLVNSGPIRSHQVNGIILWLRDYLVTGKVVFLLRGGRDNSSLKHIHGKISGKIPAVMEPMVRNVAIFWLLFLLV